jgi:hypothetical protein
MGTFKQLMCAVRGHEEYLHFDKNRMYLECVACGYESPGWTIEGRQPSIRFRSNISDATRESRLAAGRHAATVGPVLIRKTA